jgi:hypothetical protein
MIKFLAFGDLHFGYDKVITPQGRTKVKPIHDIDAFNATMEFADDYGPQEVLLMGDMFNMEPVSRHDMDTPANMEGKRLVEVYEKGFEAFIEPVLGLGAETHWFDGNHEAWAYKLEGKIPGISGMIDPYNYLDLKSYGVIFHPQGDVYHPGKGKLAFCHGDGLRGGKYMADKAVEDYGSSIRFWHYHTHQVYTKRVLKTSAYQTAAAIPCLCNRGPSYGRKPHINSWVHGFNYGVVEKNGRFDDAVAVIWDGRTTIAGQVYDGRGK